MRLKHITIFPDFSYILTPFDFCRAPSILFKSSLVRKIQYTKTSEKFSKWALPESGVFHFHSVSSLNLMRQRIDGELEQLRSTVHRILSEQQQELAQAFGLHGHHNSHLSSHPLCWLASNNFAYFLLQWPFFSLFYPVEEILSLPPLSIIAMLQSQVGWRWRWRWYACSCHSHYYRRHDFITTIIIVPMVITLLLPPLLSSSSF